MCMTCNTAKLTKVHIKNAFEPKQKISNSWLGINYNASRLQKNDLKSE